MNETSRSVGDTCYVKVAHEGSERWLKGLVVEVEDRTITALALIGDVQLPETQVIEVVGINMTVVKGGPRSLVTKPPTGFKGGNLPSKRECLRTFYGLQEEFASLAPSSSEDDERAGLMEENRMLR